jgi:hypothetical protein
VPVRLAYIGCWYKNDMYSHNCRLSDQRGSETTANKWDSCGVRIYYP